MTIRQILFLIFLQLSVPSCILPDGQEPQKMAFPALCECHFDNNINTAGTWLESESPEVINAFRGYLSLIPRPYNQDCEACGCGGVRLNFNNYFDCATDNGLTHLSECHKNFVGSREIYCAFGDPCEVECWDGGYFRKWNHKYLHFFFHYLEYCADNRECDCFWSELCWGSMYDNDLVYRRLKNWAEQGFLDYTFSSHWIGRDIGWKWLENGPGSRFIKTLTTEYYPNSHGIASSLVTYMFFYSQYHQMLLDVASFIDRNYLLNSNRVLDEIYMLLERLRQGFSPTYDACLRQHPHPKIYYERGMLRMHAGEFEAALADIHSLMEMANSERYRDQCLLTSEMYNQEGQAYAELGQYDKAIASLTEAIARDPNNKDAYFQRAGAYFEKGDINMALADFISSDRKSPQSGIMPTLEFEAALTVGLLRGAAEAAVEFIPSMCRSTYGLGRTLWNCAKEPNRSYESFVKSSFEVAEALQTFCQTVDWDTVEGFSQQMRDLYRRYHRLNDQEKGDLIGYTIARYGVDIFIGSTLIRTVSACKKLKDANRVCNFEALLNPVTKENFVAEAMAHARLRDQYFANVRIHWGKQNKHIPGAHNFDPERGRIKISNARLEELVRQNAGKGRRVNNVSPLSPDYRERIDFTEIIGDYALQVEGKPTEFLPTTKGILRYCKDGVHVSPANPNSM